jgi:S-formylglutathione hydrolase FrmB
MTDSSYLVGDNGVTNNGLQEEHLDIEDIQQIMNAICFNGHQRVYKHYSKETNCHMKFSIYLPQSSTPNEKFHVVIFLSGIMCNEQNFLFKSAFQQYASEKKLIVVGADTSPRKYYLNIIFGIVNIFIV